MDELERLRRLLDDAPEPDPARRMAGRERLLAQAREEEERHAAPAGRLTSLRDLLTGRPAILAAAAITLVVVVAGGVIATLGDDDPGPQPMADAPEAETDVEPAPEEPPGEPTEPVLADSCTDEDGRYSVGYPEGWQQHDCAFFGEEPLDVDEAVGGGAALAPIQILVRDDPIEVVAEPSLGEREVSTQRTTVDGREAVRGTWESTDEHPVLPAGVSAYRYLIALDGRTLIAETTDTGDGAFDDHREVLDEMMARIDLDRG